MEWPPSDRTGGGLLRPDELTRRVHPEGAVWVHLVVVLEPAMELGHDRRCVGPGAIADFLDAFGACTEAWESPVDARPLALGRLRARIETLETLGLYVHAGSIQARLDQEAGLPLPVAIVTITRSSLPTIRLLLPANLKISDEGRMVH